jgi:tetratricopeptide (TPR) repeat protein
VADSPRIQELRRRIQQDPASLAFAPLAEALRRAGRPAEAVATCQAGLGRHPEYASARATLGRALLDLGDLDAALAELTTVLAAAPEHLAALRWVAEIHHRQGRPAEAMAACRRGLALAREDPELVRLAAELEEGLGPAAPTAAAAEASGHDRRDVVVRRLERFLDQILADRARRLR